MGGGVVLETEWFGLLAVLMSELLSFYELVKNQ